MILLLLVVDFVACSHSPAESVVTLHHSSALPHEKSRWSESISIRNQSFTCSLIDDAEANKRRAHVRSFSALMTPLSGHCVTKENVNLCINDRLEVSLPNGRTKTLLVSEKDFGIAYGDQFFTDPSSGNLSAIVHCAAGQGEGNLQQNGRFFKICRKGDIVKNEFLILNTFLNRSALVLTPSGKEEMLQMTSLGCDSDGFVDEVDFLSSSLSIDNIGNSAAHNESVIAINISSPFCGRSDQTARLDWMKNACFSADFNHRQFEYCHEKQVRFSSPKVSKMKNRISAISANLASKDSDWRYQSDSKSLQAIFKTDRTCAPILPALTDLYTIEVSLNKAQVKGVGGSFNPFFHESISGIVVFDPNHPTGCGESAYSEKLIPKKQQWIAVAERGSCMFQEKAVFAEKRGASGLIIINAGRRPMIPAMASVQGQPPLSIPSVLVDSDALFLKQFTGIKTTIRSAVVQGSSYPSPTDPLSVKVNVYCDQAALGAVPLGRTCQVGDTVMARREGDSHEQSGVVVEKFSHDSFKVSTPAAPAGEVFAGWELFKNSETPCTGQLGILITEVEQSDTCEVSVWLHSPFLCADRRFRDPPKQNRDIVCTLN